MATISVPRRVLGTAEARTELSTILGRFRRDGVDAEPVFIGSYRQTDAVLISSALADRLAPLLEDLLLADRLRDRLAEGGQPISGDVVDAQFGFDLDQVAAETSRLRDELGLR